MNNKLTEIKDCLEVLNNPEGYTVATTCMAEDELQSYGAEWLNYLLSLIEEKDKALAFYADESNWKARKRCGNCGHHIENEIPEDSAEFDNGCLARKALNTSSNNKGEI